MDYVGTTIYFFEFGIFDFSKKKIIIHQLYIDLENYASNPYLLYSFFLLFSISSNWDKNEELF